MPPTLKVSASTSAPRRLVWEEMPTKNSLPVKRTSLPSSVAPAESPSSAPISTTVRFSSDITLLTASACRDGQNRQLHSGEFRGVDREQPHESLVMHRHGSAASTSFFLKHQSVAHTWMMHSRNQGCNNCGLWKLFYQLSNWQSIDYLLQL